MKVQLTVAASLGLWLAACGGTSDPTPPTCEAGQMKVVGTLDGKDVSETVDAPSYSFGNATLQGKGELNVPAVNPQQVKLSFSQTVINGRSVSATGMVDFSATGGVHAGNCETGEEVSTYGMDADGDGATFVLRHLHADPYCSGPELDGALAGCLRFR